MKSFLNVLAISATLLAVGGCACKSGSHENVRQSTARASDTQLSMYMSNAAYGRQSAVRTFDAPTPKNAPSHASSGKQSMVRTSYAPGQRSSPPQAQSGECWSSVYYPPELKTVTERICLKEASERFEVSPAEYEWVEERVCVKQASKQFVVVPPQYETVTQNVVLDSGHTDWVRADEARCRAAGGESPVSDVFCVVNFPKVEKTLTTERLVQPASIREVEIPAEYQTVRTQRCVKPATSRRVEIPGEYTTVEKTVEVAPARWEWQRVQCEGQAAGQPLSKPKKDVRKTGYKPDSVDQH